MDESQKFWYLFIAYAIIWVLIGAYIVWLGVRQRRLQQRIEQLRSALGRDADR